MFPARKSRAAAAVDEELGSGMGSGIGSGQVGVRALLGGSSGLLSLDGQSLALPSPSEAEEQAGGEAARPRGDAAPPPSSPGLDGQSLNLDLSLSDGEDEMSSIHSSYSAYYLQQGTGPGGVRRALPGGPRSPHEPGAPHGTSRLKIIGSLRLVDSSSSSSAANDPGIPSPRSCSDPSTTSHTSGGSPTMDHVTRADTKETAQSGSLLEDGTTTADHRPRKYGTKTGGPPRSRRCLPLWIQRAPRWLRVALVASATLVVLAVVLVAVAVSLAVQHQQQPQNTLAQSPTEGAEDPPTLDRPRSNATTAPPPSSSGGAIAGNATANATHPGTAANWSVTNPSVTTFAVTGGRYPESIVDQLPELFDVMPTNLTDESSPLLLLAHLGDWNSPSATQCAASAYEDVAELFADSPVPVYFVPGDNEYNDCGSLQSQALANWRQTLVNYENTHWTPSYDGGSEVRQDELPENFYFSHSRVVFVGLNVVAGSVADEAAWDERLQLDLDWVDEAYRAHVRHRVSDNSSSTSSSGARAMVVFAHSSPTKSVNAAFFEPFFDRVATNYSNVRVVLLHRNDPGFGFEHSTEYGGVPNLDVISVLGSAWPPARVKIDLSDPDGAVAVEADQEAWLPDASGSGGE